MRAQTLLVVTLLIAIALAGCVDDAPVETAAAPAAPPSDIIGPFAVVGIIDDGINVYHEAFRDDSPRAYAHPSSYLADYPEDAIALPITFDHPDLEAAILADCALWETVEPDTLYWFPGTRIVGAISPSYVSAPLISGQGDPFSCEDAEAGLTPEIIFASSHGTMTASRAVGNGYGACVECLVVMVEGFSVEGVEWAAAQPWIDIQSNSWGPFLPAFFPEAAGLSILGANADIMRRVEAAAATQPAFWASGNGALFRFGVVGHPTQAAWHMTPSVIRVGGHDSGRVALWPGSSPHIVSDACYSWAAEHDSLDESTPQTGGGTSGATPFAAGLAAKVILDARRAVGDLRTGVREGGVLVDGMPATGLLDDGQLTIAELRAALFSTADARPDRIEQDGDVCEIMSAPYASTPVEWRAVPDGPAAVMLLGYGAVTPETANATMEAIHTGSLPARAVEAAWFAADDQQRAAMYRTLSNMP